MKYLAILSILIFAGTIGAKDFQSLEGKYRGTSPHTGMKCVLSIHKQDDGTVIVQMRESTDLLIPRVISANLPYAQVAERTKLAEERGYISLRLDYGTPSREAFTRFEITVDTSGNVLKVDGLRYKNLNYLTRSKSLACDNMKKVF